MSIEKNQFKVRQGKNKNLRIFIIDKESFFIKFMQLYPFNCVSNCQVINFLITALNISLSLFIKLCRTNSKLNTITKYPKQLPHIYSSSKLKKKSTAINMSSFGTKSPIPKITTDRWVSLPLKYPINTQKLNQTKNKNPKLRKITAEKRDLIHSKSKTVFINHYSWTVILSPNKQSIKLQNLSSHQKDCMTNQ